jgi:ubiquinone/menaquinone biosynthesis C-methylase UbiE
VTSEGQLGVTDEAEFLWQRLPLRGARLIELGCGKAELARSLLERGVVASVTALEVDEEQHLRNVSGARPDNLEFLLAGAEQIPRGDASFDVAIMLKSLHHVPVGLLDRALVEIRRVLVPGGYLYISEPMATGEFNEIVRLFHDEETVRAAAYAAIKRALAAGIFEDVEERIFETALSFRDYDDFVERIVKTTHSKLVLAPPIAAEVQEKFDKFMSPQGANFVRSNRLNLLRRPT